MRLPRESITLSSQYAHQCQKYHYHFHLESTQLTLREVIFNVSQYNVYYNGERKFYPGSIQDIVNWMNSDLVNKVIVWCVVSSQVNAGSPKSFLAISELNQKTNWSQLIQAANHVEWRGGIMRLTQATAASGGTKLTFQGNHVLISYNN